MYKSVLISSMEARDMFSCLKCAISKLKLTRALYIGRVSLCEPSKIVKLQLKSFSLLPLHLWIFTLVLSFSFSSDAALVLNGEGSSFSFSVYEQWSVSYRSYRIKYKDVVISYKSVGSSAGRDSIMNRPREVDFGGSDSPLSVEEKALKPDLVELPTLAGGIVLAYNLPACSSKYGQRLNLTREHVVGIYNGTFKIWSDPSIQAVNTNCTLPNASIIAIARRIQSGTTEIFTTALSAFDEKWAAVKGVFSDGVYENTDTPARWDPDVIRYYGPTNQDVTGLIRSVMHSVGYLSLADAYSSGLDYAALGNRKGQFITANHLSLQEAMNFKANETSLTPDLVDSALPNAYPIGAYTYLILYRTEMTSCQTATELLRYILWIISNDSAQKGAEEKGFATLSHKMAARVQHEILDHVTCKGQSVMAAVDSEMTEESQQSQPQPGWLIPVSVAVPLFLLVVGALSGYIISQRLKLAKMINMDDWNIPIEDIIFFYDDKIQVASSVKSHYLRQNSVKSFKSLGEISEGSKLLKQILQWPGKWKGSTIGIRLLDMKEIRSPTREMKKTMLWMRDSLIYTNIVRFYGMTELEGDRYIIGDFCSKGTVLDVLQNGRYNLNLDFKISVATEIASGMTFLHANGMVHGMLTSSCCMLDNRWTVKIGDWEYHKLLSLQNPKVNPMLVLRAKPYSTDADLYDSTVRDFCVAPEILRSEFNEWPTQASDMYCYSIILQEIFTRDDPYFELADYMTPQQILQAIIHNRLRPEPSPDAPLIIRQIMELAWSEMPSSRPTFDQVSKMLRRGRTGRKTIMDNMMEAMEDYTAHLEEEVEAKESALQAIETDVNNLMSEVAPQMVVSALRSGDKIGPRLYPALGIVMMEIVGSSTTAGDTEALENVVTFIGNLHQQLQQIARKYQAYCPRSHHVYIQTFILGLEEDTSTFLLVNRCHEVAHMALDILGVVTAANPPWNDASSLSVRLGAHVGTVATGIMGVTTPTFLLFGQGMDTCRALLTSNQLNTIRISRSLFTHLEKSSVFKFLTEDPDWITCNGADIEAFVMIGRNSEPLILPSDTSLDSGIEIERASHLMQQQDQPKNKTTDEKVERTIKPNSRTHKQNLGRSIFPTVLDESHLLPGQPKNTGSNTNNINSSNYRHQKSLVRPGRSGPVKHRLTEASIEQNYLSLAGTSKVSDMSDIAMTPHRSREGNLPSNTAFNNFTTTVGTEQDSVHNSALIAFPEQPPVTSNDPTNCKSPDTKERRYSLMAKSLQPSVHSLKVPNPLTFENQINAAESEAVKLSKYPEAILANTTILSEDSVADFVDLKFDINSAAYETAANKEVFSDIVQRAVTQRTTGNNSGHQVADDEKIILSFKTCKATNGRRETEGKYLENFKSPGKVYSKVDGGKDEHDKTGIKLSARTNKIHPG